MDVKKLPIKKKRSQSFLGIHFDFHATEKDTGIGENVTEEMIAQIIDQVHPDYLQCDCKGHTGISSYPTIVGKAAPDIKRDILKIWRDVTNKKGVSLYMHYSGVWDTEAIKQHPEWARVDEKGEIDHNNTSVFGPYVDELFIPQIKELSDNYGVDGVWVDGECWATCHDYCDKAVMAFSQATGISTIPRTPEEPYYNEYSDFCREAFKNYLSHYVDEIHKFNPDFEIASNWAFTSFMPEPVGVNVDFISGDFSLQNGVNSARLEGRCMTRQGKPWDLMAWAFSAKWGEEAVSTKSVLQLQQEAAIVIALGGGFQAYFTQKRDGSVSLWQMKLMKKISEFCRERQTYCHRAEAVPQIGLFYSKKDFYQKNRRLFGAWDGNLIPIQGILLGLLDNQYSVEVLMDHNIQQEVKKYPLLIIPECEHIEEETRNEILNYVNNGGNLIIIGPYAVKGFKDELKIKFRGDIQKDQIRWILHRDWMAGIKTDLVHVSIEAEGREYGKLYYENDNTAGYTPAATIGSYGRGMMAGIYMNIGSSFINGYTSTIRNFLGDIVKELFPKPMVEVKGSHKVDVVINKMNGKLAVNLVNTDGPHSDKNVYVYDEIPTLGPLTIIVRVDHKPKKITLQPENVELSFDFIEGAVVLVLKKLEIHSIILIE